MGCCSYPNGFRTLIPSLLLFPTLILSLWGVSSCDFVYYESESERNINLIAIGLFWKYFSYENDPSYWDDEVTFYFVGYYCSPYNAFGESVISYDGNFKAARGFGSVAAVCGIIMTILVWIISPCIPLPKTGWRIIGLILALIGLFQLLTLLILSSDACSSNRCTYLGLGGKISIAAGVLWLVSAGSCFCIGDPKNESEQLPVTIGTPLDQQTAPQSQQVQQVVEETTTQQRVEEDGTIVIETTTKRADGGVTVKTEVIPPGTAVGSVAAGKM